MVATCQEESKFKHFITENSDFTHSRWCGAHTNLKGVSRPRGSFAKLKELVDRDGDIEKLKRLAGSGALGMPSWLLSSQGGTSAQSSLKTKHVSGTLWVLSQHGRWGRASPTGSSGLVSPACGVQAEDDAGCWLHDSTWRRRPRVGGRGR